MKTSIRELFYLFLSLLLIGLASFIYITQANRHTVSSANKPATVTKTAQAKQQLEKWQAELEALEQAPTAEGLAALKEAYQKLPDSYSKERLAERLTRLEDNLGKLTAAQEALSAAETSVTQSSVDQAQASIDALELNQLKADLQTRLDAVKAKIAEQTAAASQQPVEETAPQQPYTPPVTIVETPVVEQPVDVETTTEVPAE